MKLATTISVEEQSWLKDAIKMIKPKTKMDPTVEQKKD